MIRRAVVADAPAIAAIWNHAISDTTITFTSQAKTLPQITEVITAATPCYVLDQDGVQGFARYFPFRGGNGYRFSMEHTIMLTQAAQGKGAGRALLDVLCSDAKAAGIHTMHAGISAENQAAVKFHTVCGFQTLAILPEVGFKFGRWIDLVLMQKRL